MGAALKLHDRPSLVPPEDRGPMVPAAEVAARVWNGIYSAKWVIEHMAPLIGFKLGKSWYFYLFEAERWRDAYITKRRGKQ